MKQDSKQTGILALWCAATVLVCAYGVLTSYKGISPEEKAAQIAAVDNAIERGHTSDLHAVGYRTTDKLDAELLNGWGVETRANLARYNAQHNQKDKEKIWVVSTQNEHGKTAILKIDGKPVGFIKQVIEHYPHQLLLAGQEVMDAQSALLAVEANNSALMRMALLEIEGAQKPKVELVHSTASDQRNVELDQMKTDIDSAISQNIIHRDPDERYFVDTQDSNAKEHIVTVNNRVVGKMTYVHKYEDGMKLPRSNGLLTSQEASKLAKGLNADLFDTARHDMKRDPAAHYSLDCKPAANQFNYNIRMLVDHFTTQDQANNDVVTGYEARASLVGSTARDVERVAETYLDRVNYYVTEADQKGRKHAVMVDGKFIGMTERVHESKPDEPIPDGVTLMSGRKARAESTKLNGSVYEAAQKALKENPGAAFSVQVTEKGETVDYSGTPGPVRLFKQFFRYPYTPSVQ